MVAAPLEYAIVRFDAHQRRFKIFCERLLVCLYYNQRGCVEASEFLSQLPEWRAMLLNSLQH
jgi:hypothetical protein